MIAPDLDGLREKLDAIPDLPGVVANLLALAPVALGLFDPNGRRVQANEAFHDLFGREHPPDYDLREDETLARVGVSFYLRRAFSGETVTTPVFWFEKAGEAGPGRRRRVALSASAFPIAGRDGAIELVATLFHDHTDSVLLDERRRPETDELRRLLDETQLADRERHANQEQFRAIFEHCSDGVMITDDKGRVLDINPAGCQIAGRPREAVIGEHFWENLVDTVDTRGLSERFVREGSVSADIRMRRADGELRELEIRSVAGILPGRHLSTFNDVTERNDSERSLQRSQRRLQLIMDSAPVGIAYFDREQRHVFVNNLYASRLGRTPDDLVGLSIREVWGEELHRTIGPQVDATLAGDSVEFEVTLRPPGGGDAVFVRSSHVPDRDAQGWVRGVVAVLTDLTGIRRGEEKLRESQIHLVASQRIAHVGSWEYDLDAMPDLTANPLRCSDEGYRMFGYEPGEVDVTPDAFFSMVHPEDRPGLAVALREAIDKRGVYSYEYRIRIRDRSERVVHSRAELIYDQRTGEPLRLIGTTQDITERVRANQRIQKLYEELEQRVVERTAELAAVNSDLEAFAYSVSHDLRAPLRAINGYAQILLHEYERAFDEEGRRALLRIEISARRMDKLIDDLLAFSRLGRQDVEILPVAIRPVVDEALEDLGVAPGIDEIEIEIGQLPECRADPGLLKQVFVNLLGNAVKFSRGRLPPRIEVGCRMIDGEPILYVRDNGIGFDMAHAERLFGVFQRFHISQGYEGTGVGLALVERIVTRHGGRIWAEGVPNKGATFYFTMQSRPS